MTPHKAKQILQLYQEWRLSADIKMLEPAIITKAINVILAEFNPIKSIKRIEN